MARYEKPETPYPTPIRVGGRVWGSIDGFSMTLLFVNKGLRVLELREFLCSNPVLSSAFLNLSIQQSIDMSLCKIQVHERLRTCDESILAAPQCCAAILADRRLRLVRRGGWRSSSTYLCIRSMRF